MNPFIHLLPEGVAHASGKSRCFVCRYDLSKSRHRRNSGVFILDTGRCPIGPNPRQGVINGKNRVYGHEGLYVVDGSMIPANLDVNPSLTLTAMAEHAMSHISPKITEMDEA